MQSAAQDLNDSMQSHLRLHFSNEEASDEQVYQAMYWALVQVKVF